jgi:hypothetical protein
MCFFFAWMQSVPTEVQTCDARRKLEVRRIESFTSEIFKDRINTLGFINKIK